MRRRTAVEIIRSKHKKKFGRIVVLTGARQTGKTTLVRRAFPDHEYISIEDPAMRETYTTMTAALWKEKYPKAILDEIQKEPKLVESIKAVYDQWDEPKYILLGSSQLLLMEKVRESLAGRCIIMELFPLTIPELRTRSWNDKIEPSYFQKLFNGEDPVAEPSFLLNSNYAKTAIAYEHYLKYGGYPAISDYDLPENDRFEWLTNYVRTYLERDIRDLASFRDLDPFIKLQKYVAQNTANLINASSVAKQIGISVKTVQRYINYLEISYQSFSLPSWSGNINKRLVKSSKVHFLDHGILQAVLQRRGGLSGNEYESAIVSEIYKQAKNAEAPCSFSFLRTHDGREVDLLLEFADHFYAVEIKLADKVRATDARHLNGLEDILNKPVKQAFLLSNDPQSRQLTENCIAMHAGAFLG